ncbi:hypothetical protein AF72_08085 [Xylella taiwanensis]|uniref:Uncharacterized protein n=1 Tax=Xylella taiwanensis TaxID=1444770 RepID=Z9JJ13_9GAMM|nr:hypothetical protein AF72_08085 [Xylella taiwanensis]
MKLVVLQVLSHYSNRHLCGTACMGGRYDPIQVQQFN